jgi:hypothetical protein
VNSHAVLVSLTLGLLVAAPATAQVDIRVLSSRPDVVTGGDALVEITGSGPPTGAAAVTVVLNGRDVTRAFRAAVPGGPLRGRIEGLIPGANTVDVRSGNRRLARTVLTNHSINGPVISGPQQMPFICQTEEAGLGPARDAQCSAATVVAYIYRSTAIPQGRGGIGPASPGRGPGGALPAGFKPYDPAAPRPGDLAQTTTTDGRTVDYIVRRERGTINRAVYEIAFLHVPGEPLPDPWTTMPGWNGRLVYSFGGGCSAGYRQGEGVTALILPVSVGYAVATSTLNILGNACDDVISAETMMMVKEHFIERFGPPAHTIGTGGSGGAMQQHLIAQNYPGLLDGLLPSDSYPDVVTMVPIVVDCSLLARAFEGATEPFTDAQKTAVSGYATWRTCADGWNQSFSPNLVRATACDGTIPRTQVYDPTTNPKGTRCAVHDNQVKVYGRDPKTGFARRPVDNVGVQYGLVAFNSGIITAQQFLDLNERVGGYDIDGNLVAARTMGDPIALRAAHETGRVNTGGGSLATIPIIDSRRFLDPMGNIHDSFRSFVTRARLLATNGRADNHVILRMSAGGQVPVSPVNLVRMMDAWLTAMGNDRSNDPQSVKVARNRPPDVADACYTEQGERIVESASYAGTGRCNQLYPPHADPRLAAGAPLTGEILKCELKAIDARDYKQPLAGDQLARLRAVFPNGVCDYSRPGVGQRRISSGWKRY